LSEQRQTLDNMILLKIASAGKSESDEESRTSSDDLFNDESLFKELQLQVKQGDISSVQSSVYEEKPVVTKLETCGSDQMSHDYFNNSPRRAYELNKSSLAHSSAEIKLVIDS